MSVDTVNHCWDAGQSGSWCVAIGGDPVAVAVVDDATIAVLGSAWIAWSTVGADGALTRAGCVGTISGATCGAARGLGHRGLVVVPGRGVIADGGTTLAVFRRDPYGASPVQANGAAGCVSADGSDGCLALPGMLLDGVAVAPDGADVYALSVEDAGWRILRFALDPVTLGLTYLGCDGTLAGCTALELPIPWPSGIGATDGSVYLAGQACDGTCTLVARLARDVAGGVSYTPGPGSCLQANAASTECPVAAVAAAGFPFGIEVVNGRDLVVHSGFYGWLRIPLAPDGTIDPSATAAACPGAGLCGGQVASVLFDDAGVLVYAGSEPAAIAPDGSVWKVSLGAGAQMVHLIGEVPPTCAESVFTTHVGMPLEIPIPTCVDRNGDAIQAGIRSAPVHGSLTQPRFFGQITSLLYRPMDGFVGDDDLGVIATDGEEGSTSTITIRVLPLPTATFGPLVGKGIRRAGSRAGSPLYTVTYGLRATIGVHLAEADGTPVTGTVRLLASGGCVAGLARRIDGTGAIPLKIGADHRLTYCVVGYPSLTATYELKVRPVITVTQTFAIGGVRMSGSATGALRGDGRMELVRVGGAGTRVLAVAPLGRYGTFAFVGVVPPGQYLVRFVPRPGRAIAAQKVVTVRA